MSRIRKVDANQLEIVQALRLAGCWVDCVSMVGAGFPDIIAARPDGRVFTVEIKTPEGTLTDDEVHYIVRRVMPGYRIFHAAEEAVQGILSDQEARWSAD